MVSKYKTIHISLTNMHLDWGGGGGGWGVGGGGVGVGGWGGGGGVVGFQ